jgi:hypothetical protein
VRNVEEDWFTAPIITADFPMFAEQEWLRLSLGVSLKDPARDWFVGFSPLQAIWGVAHENMGMDLHLVMHAGRRRVLRNPDCLADGAERCVINDRFYAPLGFGFSAMVDGTALLSTLSSIFR